MSMMLNTVVSTAEYACNLVKTSLKEEVEQKMNQLRDKMIKEVDEYIGVLKNSVLERIEIDFTREETDSSMRISVKAKLNDQELLNER